MSSSDPTPLHVLLPRLLGRLAGDTGKAHALSPVWQAVVGPQVARHARAHALEGGTLVVTVTSAEWARTLEAQAPALEERLAAALGPGVVRALAFRLE